MGQHLGFVKENAHWRGGLLEGPSRNFYSLNQLSGALFVDICFTGFFNVELKFNIKLLQNFQIFADSRIQ